MSVCLCGHKLSHRALIVYRRDERRTSSQRGKLLDAGEDDTPLIVINTQAIFAHCLCCAAMSLSQITEGGKTPHYPAELIEQTGSDSTVWKCCRCD